MSARLRLMPVVMTAAAALLALKAIGFSTHTSYLFVQPASAASAAHNEKPAPAGETPAVADDHGKEETTAPAAVKPVEKQPVDSAGELATDPSSQGALIQALAKRRAAMDAKTADLAAREALLEAAQKRMDDRLAELKRLEQTIAEADKRRADEEAGKLKELVALYEGMKPKEAARIFGMLDSQVLLDVASRMKPRTMSAVMGLMTPEAAQKLTVALARREAGPALSKTLAASDLPKIEGRPTGR